jgi:hypothetical protein
VRCDPAGRESLALAEARGPIYQPRGHEREEVRQVREVGGRVHSHEDEVFALGEHVLVDLLWPLRDQDQVEAELAPLARDADDRIRRQQRRPSTDVANGSTEDSSDSRRARYSSMAESS